MKDGTEPTVSSELIERLAERPSQYVNATYKALQAGNATKEQQQAAAAGMALDCSLKSQAASGISSLLERERTSREQGQAEGFAAAVQWLRDRSSIKPPAALWHAASLLADQMEQSRKPGSADISEDA